MSPILYKYPGAGLSFRSEFRPDLFLNRGSVDCLEIIADHYFNASPEKLAELDLLASHFTLLPHSLDLSIGSADGLDSQYLDQLAALVERLSPPWWSDHLAITRAGGLSLGHLSPISTNQESLDVVLKNLQQVQRRIPSPMLLENITWNVHLPDSNIDEGDFLRQVLEGSGTGLLLDVTNLHTNCANHHRSPEEFLNSIPLERVVQLHLAGGHHGPRGQWIDSHSRAIPEEVWSLLEVVLSRTQTRAIIVERDECLPPFFSLVEEVSRARVAAKQFGRWT